MIKTRSFLFLFLPIVITVFYSCNPGSETAEQNDTNQPNPAEEYEQIPSIKTLTQKIEEEPDNPELFYERCKTFLEMGFLAKALSDITKALKLDSTQTKYYTTLANIYFAKKEYPRAIETLEDGLAVDPDNVDILLLLTRYNFYIGEQAQAIKYADQVLQVDIYNPTAYFFKGMIFKEIGDTSKAISSFQTATEQEPEYYDAYMQLGLLYSALGKELAVDYFSNAARLDPHNDEPRYAIAMYYQNKKEFQKAIDAYKTLIANNPQNQHAYYNIGYIYFQMDSIKKADKNFELALSVSPEYADAFYMRGLCAEVSGNIKEASYYYEQALNLSPEHELAQEGIERLKSL